MSQLEREKLVAFNKCPFVKLNLCHTTLAIEDIIEHITFVPIFFHFQII
jgi:hypothetical protein